MMNYTEKIQEAARRLLSEGKVDLVIGYRRGTIPMMNEPTQVRQAEQADRLYWDSFCGVNLANYLPKRTERMAIVAKGCDSRNIVVHLQEGQIKREQLVILGAPCQGMLDRRKVWARLNGQEPLQVSEDGSQVLLEGKGFKQSFDRSEFLQDNCAICVAPQPGAAGRITGRPGPGTSRGGSVRRYPSRRSPGSGRSLEIFR